MNDIYQYLTPQLSDVNIEVKNCKIDVTTNKTGKQRGDIWISSENQKNTKKFEDKIVCLIEAKHRNANIGDFDWKDAMDQGHKKALKQNLNYFVVTNCTDLTRYYNAYNCDEIYLDENIITKILPLDILIKIQTQVSPTNSHVYNEIKRNKNKLHESKFRATLKHLESIYRSAGIKKGDERIDPTISFIILKYISENENEYRTLSKNIKLWDDLRDDVNHSRDIKSQFNSMIELIWGSDSEYNDNIYKDFKDLISFNDNLKNGHYLKIYNELDDDYHFHGADFDLFGAIYEEFASKAKKKEFGEFYTSRHITSLVSKLLLHKEITPREMYICDPACGTGGFLTEGFNTLIRNYDVHRKLNDDIKKKISENVFWGYDSEEKSVARTKINMFLAGDGHTNIHDTDDSLIGWNYEIGWCPNNFDYIMTNPPMGTYEGEAEISSFNMTNEKRYEVLFLEKVIDATKEGGEIAIVMNDGVLENPTNENVRIELLNRCDINAIISLTKFAFAPYTKEKTYVLFLQKKLSDDLGKIQKYPIWNFIIDYDGFANSDKRFKTKYHNDLLELEKLFVNAVNLAQSFIHDPDNFFNNKNNFERKVNEKEKLDGLYGWKSKYVTIDDIINNNYNLLSEFYLRNYEVKTIEFESAKTEYEKILNRLGDLLNESKN